MTAVALHPIDDDRLDRLAEVARTEAEPEEVMPVEGTTSGWTPRLVQAFHDFHRKRADDQALRTYAVMADGEVVGSIRLDAIGAEGVLETGVWLARSARGKGIGGRALGLVLAEARQHGADAVIASTRSVNRRALGILRHHGARVQTDGDVVRARFDL